MNKTYPDYTARLKTAFPLTIQPGDALMAAIERDDLVAVQKLLRDGVNPDNPLGEQAMPLFPPLVLAARDGKSELLKMLLQAGANPNIRDNTGLTPLAHSATRGDAGMVGILLVTEVICKVKSHTTGGMDALLPVRAWVDLTDYSGNPPLFFAVRGGHSAVVGQLLQAGANLHLSNKQGYRALMLAAGYHHEAIVEQLLLAGADWKATNYKGQTALEIARLSGAADSLIAGLKDAENIRLWLPEKIRQRTHSAFHGGLVKPLMVKGPVTFKK